MFDSEFIVETITRVDSRSNVESINLVLTVSEVFNAKDTLVTRFSPFVLHYSWVEDRAVKFGFSSIDFGREVPIADCVSSTRLEFAVVAESVQMTNVALSHRSQNQDHK